MKRGAFTLVELLVIVAIIGIMATTAVVSIVGGQRAVRVKGAARDVFAAIRQARSVALVTQQPVILKYSTGSDGGEPVAKVEIVSAKLMDTQTDRSDVQTVTGGPVPGSSRELVHVEKEESADAKDSEDGASMEEILFAPVSEEVVRGMRLKVLRGDESLEPTEGAAARKKISIFSNVDYLIGRYDEARAEAKKKEEEKKKAEAENSASPTAGDEGTTEEVKIVWESNGRVEPHKVWIYPDGKNPQDGLMVKVDAFGGAKVMSGDESE